MEHAAGIEPVGTPRRQAGHPPPSGGGDDEARSDMSDASNRIAQDTTGSNLEVGPPSPPARAQPSIARMALFRASLSFSPHAVPGPALLTNALSPSVSCSPPLPQTNTLQI